MQDPQQKTGKSLFALPRDQVISAKQKPPVQLFRDSRVGSAENKDMKEEQEAP
ncbi:hypothetical protein HDU84_008888, partial [Entophlyctis sp. JEL0112]